VASGDPTPDGVVLWARVSVAARDSVPVGWTVATDPALAEPVASGSAPATPEGDHTVHVRVAGLRPATTYWYGFRLGGEESPVGRTRTLPGPDDPVGRLRLGVVCCAHYATGYFNAYARLAERDVDLVVHLGDYIYEAEAKREQWTRYHRPGGRCLTLPDYRARHGQYKTDPDLQRLHARHPFVAVWDDHELAGNAWWDGAAGHHPRHDGDWPHRRAAAVRAYREWMPSGLPDPSDPFRVWRTVPLGPLADLVEPELVMPLSLYLVSEACELTHEIFSVGGGRIARIFVGLTPGWFGGVGSIPTPEEVRDNLDQIRDPNGYIIPDSAAAEMAAAVPLLTS